MTSPRTLAESKGFKYWPGGDSAPEDWTGEGVLFRNGRVNAGTSTWKHHSSGGNWDVIGYRPKGISSNDIPAEPSDLIDTSKIGEE